MTLTDRTAILFPTSVGAHSVSWLASLLLHATVAFGAFIFTQQIKLAPQPTPFTWDVAMVTTAPQATTNPSGVSSPTVPPCDTIGFHAMATQIIAARLLASLPPWRRLFTPLSRYFRALQPWNRILQSPGLTPRSQRPRHRRERLSQSLRNAMSRNVSPL